MSEDVINAILLLLSIILSLFTLGFNARFIAFWIGMAILLSVGMYADMKQKRLKPREL